jgi:hypothetical protein
VFVLLNSVVLLSSVGGFDEALVVEVWILFVCLMGKYISKKRGRVAWGRVANGDSGLLYLSSIGDCFINNLPCDRKLN